MLLKTPQERRKLEGVIARCKLTGLYHENFLSNFCIMRYYQAFTMIGIKRIIEYLSLVHLLSKICFQNGVVTS